MYQNSCMYRADFGIWSYLHISLKKFKLGYHQNNNTSFWKFVPNNGVRKFGHGRPTVIKCDKQATVVKLLLTTLNGDSVHGQVLSTGDCHLLITLSIQLCVQHNGQLDLAGSCRTVDIS